MCKLNKKSGLNRIDPCMQTLIERFDRIINPNVKIVGCCCGHGKYPMTLVMKRHFYGTFYIYELFSGESIERKKKFYKKDKQGYYYIPEVKRGT